MTARDITQLNRLYSESTTTMRFNAVWYIGYSDKTTFHTIAAANISDAIYECIKAIYYGPGLDRSIPIEGDITITTEGDGVFISDDGEEYAAVSERCDFSAIVRPSGWAYNSSSSFDEEHIVDIITTISYSENSSRISAEEFISKYQYKDKALAGSDDEAGLGSVLDVL